MKPILLLTVRLDVDVIHHRTQMLRPDVAVAFQHLIPCGEKSGVGALHITGFAAVESACHIAARRPLARSPVLLLEHKATGQAQHRTQGKDQTKRRRWAKIARKSRDVIATKIMYVVQ